MKTNGGKSLLGELNRLVGLSEKRCSDIALDSAALSGEEREAASLFNRILKNQQAGTEYDLTRYRLARNALGIGHWDIEIGDGDPLDPDNRFTLSAEIRRMLGFSEVSDFPDTFSNWSSRLHPDDKDRAMRVFAAHVADHTGKTPYNLEYRLKMKNGEYRCFRAVGATLRDGAGVPLRTAGAFEDITEQKNTRAKLREAEERMRVMLNALPMVLTMWDKNFNVIECSQSAVELFGFSDKRELMERLLGCAPEYQPNGRLSLEMLADEAAKAFKKGFTRLEWTHLTAGGEPIVFDLTIVRLKYKVDDALMLYSRDMRKEREMAAELARRDTMLADQAHWYKSILDAIPLPVSVTSANMNLIFVNTAAENLFGRKREELIGLPCSSWNVPICGTAECSIVRAKQGLMRARFSHNGSSYQVDTEIIRDLAGDIAGFIEILHDVTEVENAARRQADEANEAKSAFLAAMSHEMRTPLNAVIGLTELMLDGGGLGGAAESNLEKIYGAGSTLLSIVNNILDLSKINSGKFEIIPAEYDVPSMVNDAITQNLPRIGSKGIRFVLNIDENMPARLLGDELRIKQIMNNLLSNAFKYTEKGTVELGITCERDGGTVWMTIRVSDTGVGIRPEEYARMFSAYARLDARANHRIGGTGLGLSITKSLAEMMGGRIDAESAYGKGSVFTVTIRQQSVNEAVLGAELAEKLRSFRYAESKRSLNARRNRKKLPYARVLVVDDNATNLDVARGLMAPYDMQIDCVTSGREAVDAIRGEKVRYNAVFMDHMMPGMDGVEATRLIREIGTGYARSLPIIALTANAITGNEEMFLQNGFNAFISKPVDIVLLDEAILRFVRDKDQEALLDRGRMEMRRGRDRRGGRDKRDDNGGCASRGRGESGLRQLCQKRAGLDISAGPGNFTDEESFKQILHSYAVNTKPLLESIKAVDRQSLARYAITVHGIKGSSRGIGAERVGVLAEALENAAKSEDFTFVLDNNPAFIECARELVEGIEAVLADAAKRNGKPKKDRPDGELLSKLQACCDAYDMDGIDAVMAEMAAFDYESDPGFADWLRENVNRLNFAEIKEKIAALYTDAC